MIDSFYDSYDEAENKKHLYKALAIALLNEDICLSEFEDILIINTIVQYKNEYYALRQDAYITSFYEDEYYLASAICLTGEKAGELCEIRWEIKLDEECRQQCTDESEMCDWSNPGNIRFI